MASKQISVKIQSKKGSEASYFAEQDQQKLRELRIRAAEEATKKYSDEHKYHCFRCGTRSLAEIDEGKVKIDICVNENCGAVHLDPGGAQRTHQRLKNAASKRSCRKFTNLPHFILAKEKRFIYIRRTHKGA